MMLEYRVASVGEDKLKQVLRGIDAEAESQYRRGVAREKRVQAVRAKTTQKIAANAAAETRAQQKATAARERVESRSRDRRVREEQKAADKVRRYEATQYQRHLVHQNRLADKARRDDEVSAKRSVVARQRAASNITRGAGRAFSGTAGVVNSGVRTVGSIVAVGGAFVAGNAIRTRMSEEAMATQLSNQASAGADPKLRGQLLKEAQGVRGFTGEETLGALSEFTAQTGDLDTGRAIIKDLGELSLATGADLTDLAATAGSAFNVIRDQIEDPKKQIEELNSLMGALAHQGAMGAVEMRDLAGDFNKLGAATRAFEGGAPELLRKMGGFAQLAVARGGADGSADASTAAARLAGDIVTNRKKFSKLGVDVKSKKDPTKLRDPMDIMLDVLDKTKGDVEKTSGLFGLESKKIFSSLAAVYSEGEKRKKGGGRKAVEDEFARFAGAELSAETIKEKADLRASDTDVQFTEAMKKFNTEMGSRLLPVLAEAIPKIAELTPALVKLTESAIEAGAWLAENPFSGIALLIGGFLVKELAAAGIGALLEAGITAALAKAGLGGALTEVVAGAGGAAGAGKVAKAGVAGRVAGGAVAAAGGGALLGWGLAGVGVLGGIGYGLVQEHEQRAKARQEHLKKFGGGPLERFEGNALNANLAGSPAAIQAQIAGAMPGYNGFVDGKQQPLDFTKLPSQQQAATTPSIDTTKLDASADKQVVAAERLEQATKGLDRATQALQQVASRTTPIMFRPN